MRFHECLRISSVEFGEEKAIKIEIIIYFPNATDFETFTLTFTLKLFFL